MTKCSRCSHLSFRRHPGDKARYRTPPTMALVDEGRIIMSFRRHAFPSTLSYGISAQHARETGLVPASIKHATSLQASIFLCCFPIHGRAAVPASSADNSLAMTMLLHDEHELAPAITRRCLFAHGSRRYGQSARNEFGVVHTRISWQCKA